MIENNNQSQFFEFKNSNNPFYQYFNGWNNSIIIKFSLKNEDRIDSYFFKKHFPKIINKEKIIVVSSGKIDVTKKNKKIHLQEFDALNFFLDEKDFEIKSNARSTFYLVSSTNLKEKKFEEVYFNFKNDIQATDIWGGQCISRPYVGKDLNLVLFDLKPGFKFNDKGHENEQITWLIKGNMEFKCNGVKTKLTEKNGVDIGSFHPHGGISNGAIGFDAFFPKREETKYAQKNTSAKKI